MAATGAEKSLNPAENSALAARLAREITGDVFFSKATRPAGHPGRKDRSAPVQMIRALEPSQFRTRAMGRAQLRSKQILVSVFFPSRGAPTAQGALKPDHRRCLKMP
jgi:hypothetical protein